MLNKYYRLILLFLVLGIMILLSLGAKSCNNRKNAKSGSNSYNTFTINAPSNLTATANSYSQINLSWQDNSNNEDGFEMDRSTNGINYISLVTFNAGNTTFTDTGLIPFTTYYYRIRAFNTIGDRSNWSNILSTATLIPVWSTLDAGAAHCVALTEEGTVYAWGFNDQGQLGLGDNNVRNIPFQLAVDVNLNLLNNIAAIDAGYNHTVILKRDGTIWTSGLNDSGQLGLGDSESANIFYPVPGGDTDWSKIAAGYFHSLALKTNCTLWAWGDNSQGQLGIGGTWIDGGGYWYVIPTYSYTPAQVGTDSDWITVSGGYDHSLGIKTNATLWIWGNNEGGQLGIGDYINRSTPAQIGTDSDWSVLSLTGTNRSTIKAGGWYSLALKADCTLWAWGGNWYGQLGDGTYETRISPVQIGVDSDWSIVNAGMVHNFSIKTDNTLWAWGYNDIGQLGLGYSTDISFGVSTPTQVGIDSDWALVAAGKGLDNRIWWQHSIGLKTDSTLWTWGYNGFGQLGIGDFNNRMTPTNIILTMPPTKPASLLTTVISTSQINITWFDNSNNETGFKIERKTGRNGTYIQIAEVASDIASYSDISATGFSPVTYYNYRVKAYNVYGTSDYSNDSWAAISGNWLNISAGSSHAIGLKADMTLWVWGYNYYGQLGLGDTVSRITPSILNESDWFLIAGGASHTLALKSDSTIWGWGYNYYGRLGTNDTTQRNTPTQEFTSASDWSVIAAGGSHSSAIKMNATLWSWGYNYYGQLGINNTTQRTTPAQEYTNASDWCMVVAGYYHTIALKTNKTLWGWGYNNTGQLGTADTNQRISPTPVFGSDSDWSLIATGGNNSYSHTIALKINNTLWSWGHNSQGQLGLGDSGYATKRITPAQIGLDSDWSKITGGENYSIAIKANGTLWAWGYNSNGQLGLGDNTDRNTPGQVGSFSDWFSIAGGGSHSLALKTNTTLWIWGKNNYGQLGLGDTINRNVPTLVGE